MKVYPCHVNPPGCGWRTLDLEEEDGEALADAWDDGWRGDATIRTGGREYLVVCHSIGGGGCGFSEGYRGEVPAGPADLALP